MEFEILNALPVSGEYEEYECGSGINFIAIKVIDDNYSEYCVKFSVGAGKVTKAELIGAILFVIAKGRGYLFDLNKRRLISDSGIGNLTNVFVFDSLGYFVTNNNTDLYVFSVSELLWASGRISSDGIAINSVDNSVIKGQVFDFVRWVDFLLDLENFTYECEWEYPQDN